jgi:thioredoxin 1
MSSFDLKKEIHDSERSVLVQFKNSDCELCSCFSSLVSGIAKEYPEVKIIDIEAEKHPNLYGEYNISTLPAAVLFDKGKEVNRITGYNPKKTENKIREMIEKGIS